MRSKQVRALAAVGLAGMLLAACGDDDQATTESASQTTVAAPTTTTPPGAVADMAGPDGRSMGRVTFSETGGRMMVEGRLTGLPPGFHGFHVHAVGKCEAGAPVFGSAGGHMVIGTQAHPAHAGDQPALLVLGDGTAEMRFTTDRFKLSDLLIAEGRAVIVHANADNYANIPTRYVREPDATTKSTGDAGDRIACGVVGDAPGTTTSSGAPTTLAGAATTTRQEVMTSARAAGTLDCQTIGFTPQSEDAASSIKATGLPCAEAEAFVRIARRRTSSGGPAQLDVEGYRCVRVRSTQDPIPQAFYECTSGAKKVTFVRT